MNATTRRFEHSLANHDLSRQYAAAGFGGRVGWGRRAALLVIDMAGAWTRPDMQLGSNLDEALASIQRLLAVARDGGTPVFFTTMAWDPSLVEIGEVVRRKTPHSVHMLKGSPLVELRQELQRRPGEPLVIKPRASAFFGTHLLAMLISAGVDTVVVTGCSTSGCIRATCEDAFNQNLHVIVPAEAVGDRSMSAHEASLFDIDARYGDVVPASEALERLAHPDAQAGA